MESYRRWWDYSTAYDEMIRMTDTRARAMVDRALRRQEMSARINCITHILNSIPYEKVKFDEPELGKRQKRPDNFVEDKIARNVVPAVF